VEKLLHYTIQRHFPDVDPGENAALALLRRVAARQADLIARWYSVGFIHGVMNTDNMALSGETIDYGPCAFMNAYDPATVYSSIDRHGRYAYANQAPIAQWNLTRLAETLLPLIDPSRETAIAQAEEVLHRFADSFERVWLNRMRAKLGLWSEEEDRQLVASLLQWMHRAEADFTNTFRDLARDPLPEDALYQQAEFRDWHASWQNRLARQPQTSEEVRQRMRAHNPVVIPRNHRVEEALVAAESNGDFKPLQRFLLVLSRPYEGMAEYEEYGRPPAEGEDVAATFCGT
jgi:serine/tyrosine/threonine adenylyltransferase